MASPVSAIECIEIVNFAYKLFNDCRSAKDDWFQVGREVNAVRSVVQIVQVHLEDSTSIINALDDKKKTTKKQLGTHCRNCNRALKDVDQELKKYNNMSGLQRLKWAMHGSEMCDDLTANLSSFATQLDSFVDAVNLKGINAIYKTQNSLRVGIGRIEQALELNGGDTKAAVKTVMKDVEKTSKSSQSCKRYQTILEDYAEGVKDDNSKAKPAEGRGRKSSVSSTLAPPKDNNRPKSADAAKANRPGTGAKQKSPTKPGGVKKPPFTLECWLIQIKSVDALIVNWQTSEKELQPRGQCKLEEMAKQFRKSKGSKLPDNHDLVNWVIKDRQKRETNSRFVWQPYAAKIEPKGDLSLNMGVEEQAMVIIKRDLTPAEKAKKKAKEETAKAEKEAKKKQAKAKADVEKEKKAAVQAIEKQWKERQRLKDEKTKREKAERKAEIEKLRQEVEQLKVAQNREDKQDGNVKLGKKSPSPGPNKQKQPKGNLKEPKDNQSEAKGKNGKKSPSPGPNKQKRPSIQEIKPKNQDAA